MRMPLWKSYKNSLIRVCLSSKWNILFLLFSWKFSDYTFINITQWYFLTCILVVLLFVNTGTSEKDLSGQKFDIKIIKKMIQVWSNYFQVKFIVLILFDCNVMVLISTFIMASGPIKVCSNGWCLSYFPWKVSVLFLEKYWEKLNCKHKMFKERELKLKKVILNISMKSVINFIAEIYCL